MKPTKMVSRRPYISTVCNQHDTLPGPNKSGAVKEYLRNSPPCAEKQRKKKATEPTSSVFIPSFMGDKEVRANRVTAGEWGESLCN